MYANIRHYLDNPANRLLVSGNYSVATVKYIKSQQILAYREDLNLNQAIRHANLTQEEFMVRTGPPSTWQDEALARHQADYWIHLAEL